jgi:hypothetical protein
MGLKEIRWEGVDRIFLSKEREASKWLVNVVTNIVTNIVINIVTNIFAKMVTNIRVSQNANNF